MPVELSSNLRVVMAINREVPNLDLMEIEQELQEESPIRGVRVTPFSPDDEAFIDRTGLNQFGYTVETDRNALPMKFIALTGAGDVRTDVGLILATDLADQLIRHTAAQFEDMTEEEQFSFAPTHYTPIVRTAPTAGTPGIERHSVGYAIESPRRPRELSEDELFRLTGMEVEVVPADDKPGDLRFIWSVGVPPDRGGPANSIVIVDMEDDCVRPEMMEDVLEEVRGTTGVLRTAVVGL